VTDLLPILADAGDDFGKIIFGIIVFVVWGVGALVKMSKAQTDQSRKRQQQLDAAIRAQMEAARQREMAAAALGQRMGQPITPPPALQRHQQPQRRPARVPVRPPPMPVAMRAPQPPRQQAKKQQKRRPVSQQQVVSEVQPEELHPVLESEIGRGSVPASPTRREVAARPMLRLTPQSIRQQFILAEILQPPLALRDQPTR
jgi:hypothetical protein